MLVAVNERAMNIRTYVLPRTALWSVIYALAFISILSSMSFVIGLLFDMLGYDYERLIAVIPLSLCYLFLHSTGMSTHKADKFSGLRLPVILVALFLQGHFLSQWVQQYDYTDDFYFTVLIASYLPTLFLGYFSIGERKS